MNHRTPQIHVAQQIFMNWRKVRVVAIPVQCRPRQGMSIRPIDRTV